MKRLQDVGIGVLTPLTEQLANPLPHAMALATLDEVSSGAHKELPAGIQNFCYVSLFRRIQSKVINYLNSVGSFSNITM